MYMTRAREMRTIIYRVWKIKNHLVYKQEANRLLCAWYNDVGVETKNKMIMVLPKNPPFWSKTIQIVYKTIYNIEDTN